jgi:hypothetical protein
LIEINGALVLGALDGFGGLVAVATIVAVSAAPRLLDRF